MGMIARARRGAAEDRESVDLFDVERLGIFATEG